TVNSSVPWSEGDVAHVACSSLLVPVGKSFFLTYHRYVAQRPVPLEDLVPIRWIPESSVRLPHARPVMLGLAVALVAARRESEMTTTRSSAPWDGAAAGV